MYAFAIFLPLIGAVLAGFFGRIGSRTPGLADCHMWLHVAVGGYRLCDPRRSSAGWRSRARLSCSHGSVPARSRSNWSLRFDTLTAVMVFVVTVVSSMVHIYSVGYMSHDPHIAAVYVLS